MKNEKVTGPYEQMWEQFVYKEATQDFIREVMDLAAKHHQDEVRVTLNMFSKSGKFFYRADVIPYSPRPEASPPPEIE